MHKKQYEAKLDLLHLDDEDLFGANQLPEIDWIPSSPKPLSNKKKTLQTQGNENRQERCFPQVQTNYKDNLKRLLKSLQDSSHSPKKRRKQVQNQNDPIDIVSNNFIRHSGNTISVQGLVNSRNGSLNRKYQRPFTQNSQKTIHCIRGSAFLYGHINQQLEVQQKIKQKFFQRESEKNMFMNMTNFLKGAKNQYKNANQGQHTKRNPLLEKRGQLKTSKNALNFLLS